MITWAAKQVNRPIKWTAERSESFLTDAHGRDHVTRAELAMDKQGKFLAMRVHTTANLGAYLSTFASCVPTILYATLLAGQYATPLIYCEVTAVFTNTVPVDAYRGAGRPEATYVVERIVEVAAREMKIDPLEIRRRNFIPKEAMPYKNAMLQTYDSGDFRNILEKCVVLADWEGYAARKAESTKRGKLRGRGIGQFLEVTAPVMDELGDIRFEPDGSVTLYTGSHDHGQGHWTTFAQVLSAELGVPFEKIDATEAVNREFQAQYERIITDKGVRAVGLLNPLPNGNEIAEEYGISPAAVSVGIFEGQPVLDLNYAEDSNCETDMNIVMTGAGKFVELQATAEHKEFDDDQLAALLKLGRQGVSELITLQKKFVTLP